MDTKLVLAACLSLLVYYYWPSEKKKKVKVVTLNTVSRNVFGMMQVRSSMLLALGQEVWEEKGQLLIEEMLGKLSDTEQLEFQLACVYLDLRHVLNVNFNHPARILEQLMAIKTYIASKENECQSLFYSYHKASNKKNAISKDLSASLRSEEDLQNQVQSLESKLFSTDSRLQTITEKHIQKEKEVQNALEKYAKILQESANLKRSLEEQRDKVGSLELENSRQRKNSQALTERVRVVETEWQRQHEAGKKSLAEKDGKLNQKLAENQSLKRENEALQGQLRKVESDYSALCKAVNSKRTSLEDQLSASSLQISNLQLQLDRMKQELRKAQLTADQCNKGKVTLDRQIRQLRAEAAAKEQQMTEGTRRLEAKVQEWQQRTEDLACVVCLENTKAVLLMPCRHLCVCECCAENIRDCPMCRSRIVSKQKSFI